MVKFHCGKFIGKIQSLTIHKIKHTGHKCPFNLPWYKTQAQDVLLYKNLAKEVNICFIQLVRI